MSNIDLNAKNFLDITGFHLACYNGKDTTVEIIMDNADASNIDLKAKTKLGKTGFQLARDSLKEIMKKKLPSIAL